MPYIIFIAWLRYRMSSVKETVPQSFPRGLLCTEKYIFCCISVEHDNVVFRVRRSMSDDVPTRVQNDCYDVD